MNLVYSMRPRGISRKRFTPGLDLPSWFDDGLKGIDNKLCLIYHPYRVMWDDMMNEYVGEIEDPRYTIHQEFGQENWGWVLTDGQGYPIPDHSWHIWRRCDPHGWAHIIQIEDKHGHYLHLILKRLYLQAKFTDRYGHRAWGRQVDDEHSKEAEVQQKDKESLFNAFQEENKWLLNRAKENFERGRIAPTNPTHESIVSYPGQVNRSRIVRPLDDREGGLVIPE